MTGLRIVPNDDGPLHTGAMLSFLHKGVAVGLRVAKIAYSGSKEYDAYDALGNVRVVNGSDGARLNTLAYHPFGICHRAGTSPWWDG